MTLNRGSSLQKACSKRWARLCPIFRDLDSLSNSFVTSELGKGVEEAMRSFEL